jgi:hypothetical protein
MVRCSYKYVGVIGVRFYLVLCKMSGRAESMNYLIAPAIINDTSSDLIKVEKETGRQYMSAGTMNTRIAQYE